MCFSAFPGSPSRLQGLWLERFKMILKDERVCGVVVII